MDERAEESLVSEALKATTDDPLVTCTWTQPGENPFPTLCYLCYLLFKFSSNLV